VNTPVQVALPVIGIAMAGTDNARNAPQARPPSKSFFGLFVIMFLHPHANQCQLGNANQMPKCK
jgi:hypothetical protein